MKPYTITWSPSARITYFQILEYLEEYWTHKEMTSFIERTEDVLNHIADTPLIYEHSVGGDIHRCVVVKQISLYYRIRTTDLELLIFWDNRQDPAKLIL